MDNNEREKFWNVLKNLHNLILFGAWWKQERYLFHSLYGQIPLTNANAVRCLTEIIDIYYTSDCSIKEIFIYITLNVKNKVSWAYNSIKS